MSSSLMRCKNCTRTAEDAAGPSGSLRRHVQAEKGVSSLTSILMAAAYGDKRSDFRGAGPDRPVSTPLDLVDEQLVSLAPWTPNSGSLQLTDNEWAELWDAFLRQTRIPLTAAVQDFIWSICGGQVSCVTVAHSLFPI